MYQEENIDLGRQVDEMRQDAVGLEAQMEEAHRGREEMRVSLIWSADGLASRGCRFVHAFNYGPRNQPTSQFTARYPRQVQRDRALAQVEAMAAAEAQRSAAAERSALAAEIEQAGMRRGQDQGCGDGENGPLQQQQSKKGSPLRWGRSKQQASVNPPPAPAAVIAAAPPSTIASVVLAATAEPEVGPMTKQRVVLQGKPSAPPMFAAQQPGQQQPPLGATAAAAASAAGGVGGGLSLAVNVHADSDVGAHVSGLS
jgi:hypothetical protein